MLVIMWKFKIFILNCIWKKEINKKNKAIQQPSILGKDELLIDKLAISNNF